MTEGDQSEDARRPEGRPERGPRGAHGAAQDVGHNVGHGGERPLWPALVRGWGGRCPNCGGGPMLSGYLRVRDHCAACGEALHHHRADDLPAWGTILIVGHIVGLGLFHVEHAWRPPLWVHWAAWPTLAAGLIIWLLPRIKGAAVALQWSRRMHGFGEGGG